MKKSTPWGTWLVIIIICIPIVYALRVYSSLPDIIPIHFDMEGKPNGYANKNSLWFVMLLMTAVSSGVYLLIKNLPRIDPKKTASQSPEVYNKIALAVVIFMCIISIVIVYSSYSRTVSINKLMLPLLGLFFTVLGNYMHSIKPNYFVGFRIPWTLENEDNWKKTHQLVGKLWVPGGLLITIGTLLLPVKMGFILLYAVLAPMIIIPIIFSYRYFKKRQ